MRIFIQGENIEGIKMMEIVEQTVVREIVQKAAEHGFPLLEATEEIWVGFENQDRVLILDEILVVDEDVRIHCHRCHRISVSCTFNGRTITEDFPPSTTMNAVKAWVVGPDGFNMPEVDAVNHSLQVCGTTVKPGQNVHIGSLVQHPNCTLCLELVPSDRHQG